MEIIIYIKYLSAVTSIVFSVICILMRVYRAYTPEISDLNKEWRALAASLTSTKSVEIHVIRRLLVSYAIMAEAEENSTGAKKKVIRSQDSMQSKKENDKALHKTRATLSAAFTQWVELKN